MRHGRVDRARLANAFRELKDLQIFVTQSPSYLRGPIAASITNEKDVNSILRIVCLEGIT